MLLVLSKYKIIIGLFSIAPHLVNALPTLSLQKLSLLTSLLNYCICFVH